MLCLTYTVQASSPQSRFQNLLSSTWKSFITHARGLTFSLCYSLCSRRQRNTHNLPSHSCFTLVHGCEGRLESEPYGKPSFTNLDSVLIFWSDSGAMNLNIWPATQQLSINHSPPTSLFD